MRHFFVKSPNPNWAHINPRWAAKETPLELSPFLIGTSSCELATLVGMVSYPRYPGNNRGGR